MSAIENLLSEIEARANAATAGPWQYSLGGCIRGGAPVTLERGVVQDQVLLATGSERISDEERFANGVFSAAARTDVPKLIRLVRLLVAEVRDVRDNWDCDSDAHKHGTVCRCCSATEVLARVEREFHAE